MFLSPRVFTKEIHFFSWCNTVTRVYRYRTYVAIIIYLIHIRRFCTFLIVYYYYRQTRAKPDNIFIVIPSDTAAREKSSQGVCRLSVKKVEHLSACACSTFVLLSESHFVPSVFRHIAYNLTDKRAPQGARKNNRKILAAEQITAKEIRGYRHFFDPNAIINGEYHVSVKILQTVFFRAFFL